MIGLRWLLLVPLMLLQGWWVRKKTPRFPDAAGPIEGVIRASRVDSGPSALNLIVLGESTVAGIGAPTHEKALTGQVARALAHRTGCQVNWLAVGLSGATARDAAKKLVPRLKGRRAHALVIALGVNDSIDHALRRRAEERWANDIRKLIDGIRRELGEAPIVISGAPPLGRFPAFPEPLRSFLGKRSSTLDQASAKLAATLPNVVFAPMAEGWDESHFCEDKFHPSVKGYAAWSEHLITVYLDNSTAASDSSEYASDIHDPRVVY